MTHSYDNSHDEEACLKILINVMKVTKLPTLSKHFKQQRMSWTEICMKTHLLTFIFNAELGGWARGWIYHGNCQSIQIKRRESSSFRQ